MKIIDTIYDLRVALREERADGRSIGFVPTMGFLHAGHESLMKESLADNDVTVVSIFVNPLQFSEGEDLGSYPVNAQGDQRLCELAGVDYLFTPNVGEMYRSVVATSVSVAGVSMLLEGRSRPTHFTGVATVVAKLFSIVGPCSAYFGAKDWQQVAVVRRMTEDLSLPVAVVDCPIVREVDGLALSSRNIYLSDDERSQAPTLHHALLAGAVLVESGETDPLVVEAAIEGVIASAPLALLDYVAAVQADTLTVDGPLHGDIRLLVAARFGRARLIDNHGCRNVGA